MRNLWRSRRNRKQYHSRPALFEALEQRTHLSVTPTTETFADGFEAGSLNPFWNENSIPLGSSIAPSTSSVTDAAPRQGNQTVKFAIAAGQAAQLTHRYDAPVYGSFSVWLFDTGAGKGVSGYINFYAASAKPDHWGAVISTREFDDGQYYAAPDSVNTADNYDSRRTGVTRSQDWHHFQIDVAPTSVTFHVDQWAKTYEESQKPISTINFLMNSQAGSTWNTYFDDFQAVTYPATPVKADQSIAFGPLPDKTYGDAPFQLAATASSGLPISYAVSGPATIDQNNILTITGAGDVTVTASQSGNDLFNPAADVSQTFSVAKADTSVTLSAAANQDASIRFTAAVSATAPVDGSVAFTIVDATGNTLAQSTVPVSNGVATADFFLTEGTFGVSAIYAESANFNASADVGTLSLTYDMGTDVAFHGGSIGFWTNKNAAKLVTTGDLSQLNDLYLVDALGSRATFTDFASLKNWLLSASATNMSYMLSAQMVATKLNILHGLLDPNALVDVSSLAQFQNFTDYVQQTYQGSLPSFMTVNDLLQAANSELQNDQYAIADDAHRAYQEALKNLLESINSNRSVFLLGIELSLL